MRGRLSGWMLCLAMLGACSSPAPRFYQLSSSALPPAAGPYSASVIVLPLRLPPSLDRSQLVLVSPGTSAKVLENDRWLSPLGDQMRRALVSNLAAQLPNTWIDSAGDTAPESLSRAWRLRVEIERSEIDGSGSLQLYAAWSATQGVTRMQPRRATIQIAVHSQKSDYQWLAAGLSQGIEQLAARIGADLREQGAQ